MFTICPFMKKKLLVPDPRYFLSGDFEKNDHILKLNISCDLGLSLILTEPLFFLFVEW